MLLILNKALKLQSTVEIKFSEVEIITLQAMRTMKHLPTPLHFVIMYK